MRQALIAVGVFAALLVVVLATREGGNVNVGVRKLELPVVDKANVTAVEISGAQAASLKKEAAGWTVGGHRADEAQVNAMLDGLGDFKAGDFITERAERLAELEVDDAKGLRVKFFTGGAEPALDVVFGKQGKSGGSYLRAGKGSQVFLTTSGLIWAVRRDTNGWRKRSFYPAPVDQLAKVTVKLEDGSALSLESAADGKWALGAATAAPAGFRFDSALAGQLAGNLAVTSAADFLDAPAQDPFAAPHATVEAQLKDGKAVVLHLGAELAAATDGGHPNQPGLAARLDGDPQVYVVASYNAAQLKKRLADLRDTTLTAFDPTKATKLTIMAGGKKTVVAKEGGAWRLVEPKAAPAGFEFEPTQVTGQLAATASLRGLAVAEGVTEAQAGLKKPAGTVEVTVEGGPPQVVKFGGEGPNKQLYVTGTVDKLVYTIDPGVLRRLETGVELFKKPPPPPDMGQMRGLESLPPDVRRQLEAQLRQQQR